MEYIDDSLEEESSSQIFEDNIEILKEGTQKEKWIDSCNEDESIMQQCLKLQDKNTDICESNYNENEETSSETLSNKNLYTFTWSEGGEEVKVTGSFSDWKHEYLMKKDPNDNIFKYKLPLNNEVYQYKYIIDGVWKCASTKPTICDGHGNLNNLLDLTKPNQQINKDEENKKKGIAKKNQTKVNEYGNKYPTNEEMFGKKIESGDTQSKPFILGLRSKQNKILEKKFLKKFDKDAANLEKSFKPLFRESHVNLEHMIYLANKNKKNNKNENTKNKSKVEKSGVSFRYREKACTFIYFKSQ